MKTKTIWQKLKVSDRNETDDELMELIKQGQHSAFEVLFDRHGGKVLGYAHRLMGNSARAEDISQEVWMRVVRNVENYKAQGHFIAWAYTITRNVAFSQLRKQNDWEMLNEKHEESFSLEEELSSRLEKEDDITALKKRIDELPSTQRAALTMHLADQLSYEEIAQELGTSVSSVKSLLFRARKKLRESWEEIG